ncbi:hypothetical protein CYMTET_5755 [Cymbomonas tetramitiformis]|uniref:Uncharacterized protein n=1 Tax=Cymbomonas tetramitiformis TaxID=36881 RepID=A0AAE0H0F9_9CHLO|nr:hypothetical protein CYMTET_5755 [Cymbomonas tetramitiformis]
MGALIVAIYQAWAQTEEGAVVREKRTLGTDGKPSALVTSSEYAVLLDEIAAFKAKVFQDAADEGPEAFVHAASAYGPPAAAQEKVHFTHASFIPRSGVEERAPALVCGPAAAAGIMPEEQGRSVCIYSGVTELGPVTLGAILDSPGAAAVTHRLPDSLEDSAAHCYHGHCGDGASLAFDPE